MICVICEHEFKMERFIIRKSTACCGKAKPIHKQCATKYFKWLYPNTKYDEESWIKNTSQKLYCSDCKVNCFFCKDVLHNYGNRAIEIIHCKNGSCCNWCYYSKELSGKKAKGCLSKNKKTLKDAYCTECSISSDSVNNDEPSTLALRIICDGEDSEYLSMLSSPLYVDHHNNIYDALCKFENSDPFDTAFSDFEACQKYIDHQFSHLDPTTDNIFGVSSKTQTKMPGLYLTKESLQRVIGTTDTGWLNDHIIQQVVELLNFKNSYCSASKKAGVKVPSVVFGDTCADVKKLNPINNGKDYPLLNKDVPSSMEKANKDMQKIFAYEVKKWYRTNNHLKLDYVLSYFDKKNMKLEHYCAPLNIKDAHWVTLDVSLPNEKLPNGRVMTTDHMHEVDDPDPISKSSCNSRMWWAKSFGIYNKEKCGVNMMDNSFFSSNDLNHDSFTLEKNDKSLVCSSLDHYKNNDPNLGKQHYDRNNCGIWVLLEMFNRVDDGYKIALGDRSFDQLEIFRKYLFTFIRSWWKNFLGV